MALTLHRRLRNLSPDKLLFKQYELKPKQKGLMIATGIFLAQLAAPIGSAIYFLFTQVRYATQYGKGNFFTWFFLKDTWDRLPVHIENLLHVSWFAGQAAPVWWVVARHDARHVLIGFLVTLLISSVTIGLKERKRASSTYMAVSVPLALLAAALMAAAAILFFTRVFPVVTHLGFVTGNPWLSDWLGKGSIQLTIIGILAGLPAKYVLKRTFDTLQLISLENKLAENSPVRWWWLPNYRERYRFLKASGHVAEAHGKLMGFVMALAAPVLLFWLGFGIWLLYFGPAVGASH